MSRPTKEQAAAYMRTQIESARVAARLGLYLTAAAALERAAEHAREARDARDAELIGEVG